MEKNNTYTVFENNKQLCRGSLGQVVLKVKRKIEKTPDQTFLIFSDSTGKSMDFNFRGTEEEVLKRLEVYQDTQLEMAVGPGRPKLGVVSREVSLLPRHWEWLATQPGGASAGLRRLVEEAKRKVDTGHDTKSIQERTYTFMSVMAGDLPGYEEALRALYKKDKPRFSELVKNWPDDIHRHVSELSKGAFKN